MESDSDSDSDDDAYHGTTVTKVPPRQGQQNPTTLPVIEPSYLPMEQEPSMRMNVQENELVRVFNDQQASIRDKIEVKRRPSSELPLLKVEVEASPPEMKYIKPHSDIIIKKTQLDIIQTETATSAVGRVVWTPVRNNRITKGGSREHTDEVSAPVQSMDQFVSQHVPVAAYTPEGGRIEISELDTNNVSSTSVAERTCIRLFGISYFEIVSKLVMEAQVLSAVESRMVLLILSETDPKFPELQQKMLNAVIAIEKLGIHKTSVASFRSELSSVASFVSKQSNMVDLLTSLDVKLTPKKPSDEQTVLSPATELEVGNDLEEVTGSNLQLHSPSKGLISPIYPREQLLPVLSQVMHKVAARLKSSPSGRRQVILVASGAYNPIHKLHLRMLYIARKYLEERTDFDVLGGLVSPAHATEVRTRYRQQPLEIIPPRHRLAMARVAVGDSTWLTVDPWEITRKRVMDYMSVLEHVTQVIEACFPQLNVKVIYLCNSDVLMKLCPSELRNRGFGCLCVCRPQETDLLLHHMGSRWKNVAYVVEDAAILSRELEATTSTRVRACAIANKTSEVKDMVGAQVARYLIKHSLGAKMSGKERWTNADKKFELFSGLDMKDMGYRSEAGTKPKTVEAVAGFKHDFRFDVL